MVYMLASALVAFTVSVESIHRRLNSDTICLPWKNRLVALCVAVAVAVDVAVVSDYISSANIVSVNLLSAYMCIISCRFL